MRPDDVLISAFLDGEIPESFRAELAASIENDPGSLARLDKLKRLRATLHNNDVPELESRMAESLASVQRRVAVIPWGGSALRWRQIPVPLPAIAAAGIALIAVSAVLVWSLVLRAPASASDYLVAARDVDVTIRVDNADMESVLQWLADKDLLGEIYVQLPEQQFQIIGEPVLLKLAQLQGKVPFSGDAVK